MLFFKTCLFIIHRKVQGNTTKTINLEPCNDEFELPDDSYSVSVPKTMLSTSKTLLANPSIHIYINNIHNRLVLKMDVSLNYKHLKQRNYLAARKKLIDTIKNGENILEVVKVGLVENQYQQKSEVLYTFTPINVMIIC